MDGVTYYMQKVMNVLFMRKRRGKVTPAMLDDAIAFALDFTSATYEDMLYQLPVRQKKVLAAIAREGRATNILSGEFTARHHLGSVSSVNSAVKGLLERNLVTSDHGVYTTYDKFLELFLRRHAE